MNRSLFVDQIIECISILNSSTRLLTTVDPLLRDLLHSKVCPTYRSCHAANRVRISTQTYSIGYELTELTITLVQEGKDGTRNCFSCGYKIISGMWLRGTLIKFTSKHSMTQQLLDLIGAGWLVLCEECPKLLQPGGTGWLALLFENFDIRCRYWS